MANEHHVELLKQGAEVWNRWHLENMTVTPDFSGANLAGIKLELANLIGADLSGADLTGADLLQSTLSYASLVNANLSRAHLAWTNVISANLSGATLVDANLGNATLGGTNLTRANLTRTNLRGAGLRECNLEGAILYGCRVYGISAWALKGQPAVQANLVITDNREPTITVDNLEIAQFVYLLLHNEKIREVIDTVGRRAVLILGRFTPERKAVLDALREALRQRNYIPILFDFEKPASRDLTETISTLAHLSRFIIADLTDARSIPQELQAIVPHLPSVVVQPIIHRSQREYGMFEHFRRYAWVLPVYEYDGQDTLVGRLWEDIIQPAETKAEQMRPL